MNRCFLAAALAASLGFASHAQAVIPSGSASPADAQVGAFVPTPADAPLVQDAMNLVQSRIPSLSGVKVEVAYVQVVHGWNVKVIGTGLEDGRQVSWKFVVYKRLDGPMSMTLMERL